MFKVIGKVGTNYKVLDTDDGKVDLAPASLIVKLVYGGNYIEGWEQVEYEYKTELLKKGIQLIVIYDKYKYKCPRSEDACVKVLLGHKCTNMTKIFENARCKYMDLSDFDTSKVTNMRSMFYNACIDNLILTNFNTSNVENIRYMFQGLKTNCLDVSSFNTSNVEGMNGMFEKIDVKYLELGRLDMSKVTDTSGMFYRAKVTEGGIDLSNVKLNDNADIHSMLEQSTTKFINLPNVSGKIKLSVNSDYVNVCNATEVTVTDSCKINFLNAKNANVTINRGIVNNLVSADEIRLEGGN